MEIKEIIEIIKELKDAISSIDKDLMPLQKERTDAYNKRVKYENLLEAYQRVCEHKFEDFYVDHAFYRVCNLCSHEYRVS